jgi:hypothetical protein
MAGHTLASVADPLHAATQTAHSSALRPFPRPGNGHFCVYIPIGCHTVFIS